MDGVAKTESTVRMNCSPATTFFLSTVQTISRRFTSLTFRGATAAIGALDIHKPR